MGQSRLGAGHVFVVKGDLRNFACDAYLLSGDKELRSTSPWAQIPDAVSRIDPTERADYVAERRFTLPMRVKDSASREATPVITAVPYYGVVEASELEPRVAEFFRVAAAIVMDRSVTKRDRGLVAIPLFSASRGGGGPVRGDILRVLYGASRRAAAAYGFDVAIVLRDPRAYDLAQSIRKETEDAWAALSPGHRAQAKLLGQDAAADRLVPFMGSGVSVSAGAPTWRGLIESLAVSAGLSRADAKSLAESGRDALDQAAYLHRAFERAYPNDSDAFASAIIAAVNQPRYGLAPALLAALEAEQAITLNYDTLFEDAASDAGLPRRVIPGEHSDAERWLLKLHGTVTDKSTIVLTRDDYLGFNADRAALSALVKATLMTRRLLFVGFGMTDTHFHEIVHDVRRALPSGRESFGTVLTRNDDEVTKRLWEGDLEFISFAEEPDSARHIEIFLDALLAFASDSHSYLLAQGYESALPQKDEQLANAIQRMLPSLSPELLDTPAGRVVATALRELGWGGGQRTVR